MINFVCLVSLLTSLLCTFLEHHGQTLDYAHLYIVHAVSFQLKSMHVGVGGRRRQLQQRK